MVAEEPRTLDVNRSVLHSLHNLHDIRREERRPYIYKAEHNRIFDVLETEDYDVPDQHDDDSKEASVVTVAFFAPAHPERKRYRTIWRGEQAQSNATWSIFCLLCFYYLFYDLLPSKVFSENQCKSRV